MLKVIGILGDLIEIGYNGEGMKRHVDLLNLRQSDELIKEIKLAQIELKKMGELNNRTKKQVR